MIDIQSGKGLSYNMDVNKKKKLALKIKEAKEAKVKQKKSKNWVENVDEEKYQSKRQARKGAAFKAKGKKKR